MMDEEVERARERRHAERAARMAEERVRARDRFYVQMGVVALVVAGLLGFGVSLVFASEGLYRLLGCSLVWISAFGCAWGIQRAEEWFNAPMPPHSGGPGPGR